MLGSKGLSLLSVCAAGGTSLDLAFLHQAVVVVHLEMCLNLLQGIEHDTHHDEEGCAAEKLCEILRDTEEAGEGGQDGHYAQED